MATFNRNSFIRSNVRFLGTPRGDRSDPSPTPFIVNEQITEWDIYNQHAEKIENEIVQDWNDTLNTLLVFAALYSAVLTAFIIESMKLLQEDTSETTKNILLVISQQIHNPSLPPFNVAAHQFTVPPWALRVNYCFFVSLSCSLVTAVAAVLALQWVGSYNHGLTPSSTEGRALQRHFRTQGARYWRLEHIIASLPTIIFISLLVFFVGMAEWLWNIHPLVAIVVIVGAIFGLLFYGVTTLISMLDVAAPFHTPVSRYFLPAITFIIRVTMGRLTENVIQLIRYVAILGIKGVMRTRWISRSQDRHSSMDNWISKQISSPFHWKSSFAFSEPIEIREKNAVDKRKQLLKPSSLFWLAESLNIEDYQRHGIRVIVKAILKLPRWQRLHSNANLTAWNLIFNELHAPLAEKWSWLDYSPEEKQNATLFIKCLASIGSIVFTENEFQPLIESLYWKHPGVGRIYNVLILWRGLELDLIEEETREQSQEFAKPGKLTWRVNILKQHIILEMGDRDKLKDLSITSLEIYKQVMEYWSTLPLELVILVLERIYEESKLPQCQNSEVFRPIATHLAIEDYTSANVMPLELLDILQGIIFSQLSPRPRPRLDLESYLIEVCAYLGLFSEEKEGDGISIETVPVKECDKEGARKVHQAIVGQTIARLALIRDSDTSNGPRVQDIIHRILQHIQSPLWNQLNMDQELLRSLAETEFDVWNKQNRFDTAEIISIALNLDGDFYSGNWMTWWVEFILGLQNFIEKEADDDGELQDIIIKLGRKALEAGLLDGLSCPPDQITRLKDLTDPHLQLLASVATQSTELVRSLVPSLAELGRDPEWREFIEFSYNYISGHGTIEPSFLAVFTAGCSLEMFDRMYREHIRHLPKTPSQLSRYLVAPALATILRHADARPDESMGILESLCQLENFVLEFSKVEGFKLLPRFIRKNPLHLDEVLNIIQLAITTHPANSHSLKWLIMTHECLLSTGEAIQEGIIAILKLWKHVERNAQLLIGKLQQRSGLVAELSVEEKRTWDRLLKIVLEGLEKGYLESPTN